MRKVVASILASTLALSTLTFALADNDDLLTTAVDDTAVVEDITDISSEDISAESVEGAEEVELGLFSTGDDGYDIGTYSDDEVTITDETDSGSTEVSVDGVLLVEGVDYDITYRDNDKVGTAYVIFTFKGNYVGILEKSFEIVRKKSGGSSKGSYSISVFVTTSANDNVENEHTFSNGESEVLVQMTQNDKKIPASDNHEEYTVTLVDTNGKPKANVKVRLRDLDGAEVTGVTDANGKVVFTWEVEPTPDPGEGAEYCEPYMYGYEDGTFRPDNYITRAETAAMMSRVLETTDGVSGEFWDIPYDAWYKDSVNIMSGSGKIKGYEDGTFRPDNNITRAEFVSMLLGNEVDVGIVNNGQFPDVIDGQWFTEEILTAYSKGYIAGYEDEYFHPDDNITRAEAVTILNKVLDRSCGNTTNNPYNDVADWHWAYKEIMEASVRHIKRLNYPQN